MRTRKIGTLEVSLVGLGCNNFGGRIDQAQTERVVGAALDHGVNLFDTADSYGGNGLSERLLGSALSSRRDEAIIATKFGSELDEERRGAHPDYVRRACDDSLRRLGIEHIDLYQLHRPDPDVPIEETLGALGELVAAGKVRELGHSNLTASLMDRAAAAGMEGARFVSAQDEWSLLERGLEDERLTAIRTHNLALLPYFPLASGLLTGKYRAGEQPDEGWRLANTPAERRQALLAPERMDKVERLRALAEQHDRSLLELAMSWLANQPEVASVIAGATTPEQVASNVAAVSWQLDEDILAAVDEITPPPAANDPGSEEQR